jgi:hypothetical protein
MNTKKRFVLCAAVLGGMFAVLPALFFLTGCGLQDWSRDLFHDKPEEPPADPVADGHLGLGPVDLNFGGLPVEDPDPGTSAPLANGHKVTFDSNGYNAKAQADAGGWPNPYIPWIQKTIVNWTFTAFATPADVAKLSLVAGIGSAPDVADAAGLYPLNSAVLKQIFHAWTVIPDPDGGPSDTIPEGAVTANPATASYAYLSCDIGAPGDDILCSKGRIIVHGEPDYTLPWNDTDPDDDAEWVEYYYVDQDVTITASGNSIQDGFTLKLEKGWNAIHKHTEENGTRYYASLGNPSYLPWIRYLLP